jgi:hypothetical protein
MGDENKGKPHFSIEFADGSGGPVYFDTEEGAAIACKEACAKYPSARVWLGEEIVQYGFIAADDVGGMW